MENSVLGMDSAVPVREKMSVCVIEFNMCAVEKVKEKEIYREKEKER